MIIKNCPAITKSTVCVDDKYSNLCQDCTDCVMKRIVELCKKARNERDLAFLKIKFTGADIAKLYGKADFAKEILELLEIEECE